MTMNNNENVTESMTQRRALMEWFKEGRKFTAMDALEQLGIAQCSARICELEVIMGRRVNRKTILVTNRYGRAVRVKQYWIDEYVERADLTNELTQCQGTIHIIKRKLIENKLGLLNKKIGELFGDKKI